MIDVSDTHDNAFSDRPSALPIPTPGLSPKEVIPPCKEKDVSTVVVHGVLKEVYRTLPYWRCFLDLKHLYAHTPVVEKLETSIAYRTPCQAFAGVDVVWAVSTAVLRVQTGPCAKEVLARRREKRKRWREDTAPQEGREEGVPWCSLSVSPHRIERRSREGLHTVSSAVRRASGALSPPPPPSHSSDVCSSRFASSMFPSGAGVVRENGSTLHAGWVPSAVESQKMKSWRGVPSRVCTFHIGTLHFVHHNATAADERSFHIQSVFLYDQPHRLQCVAGMMVHFALVLYSSTRLRMEEQRTGRSLHSLWKEVLQPCAATKEEKEMEVDQRSHLLFDEDPSASPPPRSHDNGNDVENTEGLGNEREGKKKKKKGKKEHVSRRPTEDKEISKEEGGAEATTIRLASAPSTTTPPPPPPPPPPPMASPLPPISSIFPEEKETKRCDDLATHDLLASRLLFPPTTRVLVLGMGGNSMAVALRHALGPQALIHIVEIEPAVVDTCVLAGTALQEDPYCHLFVQDAKTFLQACVSPCAHTAEEDKRGRQVDDSASLFPVSEASHTVHDHPRGFEAVRSSTCEEENPEREDEDRRGCGHSPHHRVWCGSERGHSGYHMIFLDLFEPLTARMVEEDGCLLQLCYQVLCSREGGLLVANEHQLPDPQRFIPLTALFGDGRVHAVNVRGWKESVVVGWKAPSWWPLASPIGRGAAQPGDCPSTSAADFFFSSSPVDILASPLQKKEEGKDPLRKTEEEGEEAMKTKISLSCTMYAAKIVQCVYDLHVKEILPDVKTWLSSVSTCGKAPHRCRIWES